ncbi:MAG: hypothetical protein QXH90_06635 [Candidatus Korarchaeum sp.]
MISDFVRIERIHGFSCKPFGNCCRDRAVMLYEEGVRRLEISGLPEFYEKASELERYLTRAPYRMELKEDGSASS